MQGTVTTPRKTALRVVWVGLVTLGLCGCASFWDRVSSRNFSVTDLWTQKEPLTVLKESSDGYERGQALAALQEPIQHGGAQKDQDAFVQILTTAAINDREQPYCRLNAIKSLGRFKDPRAAEALRTVYDQPLRYTPELNAVIRQETLKSLAETNSPTAKHVLLLVAKEPPTTGDEHAVQESIDRRLTAVRGLSHFKDGETAEALLYVLANDKDQAMKKGAYDSLQKVTGRSLPMDAKAWDQALHPGARGGTAVVQEPQRKWWNVLGN